MNRISPQSWKKNMPEFRRQTEAFYAGTVKASEYKGFSGLYGSYAQRGGTASMLRLRMTAGRVTKEKLAFVAEMIRKYDVKRIHFTTCESIQLHDLNCEAVCEIMEAALDHGIVTMGGGGDFPRNVMCPPLSGTDPEGYFDVLPYAEAAGEYLMQFIEAEKMPRKLKVCFSDSPNNVTHATYRDLGFAAREDGTFDVYSAGGLGNHPMLGVKVAEAVAPEQILHYIKAMWLTFRAYGCYENRGKARTRYMQESLGGADQYAKAYQEKLKEVFASGEDLTLDVEKVAVNKTGDGSRAEDARIIQQKQEGLYTVAWHPIGGQPDPEVLCRLSDAINPMEGAELRLAPDETAYVINLTGDEAKKILDVTKEGAKTVFETSVACIGTSICQIGLRDSQALLAACVKAVREAEIPDGALPQIHISGCPSSCGTHQTGAIGFRGASKKTESGAKSAFVLYINGKERQGCECMGREIGTILEENIPQFLTALGREAAASGMNYEAWNEKYPEALEQIAAQYL